MGDYGAKNGARTAPIHRVSAEGIQLGVSLLICLFIRFFLYLNKVNCLIYSYLS